jgi:hypothetical protein
MKKNFLQDVTPPSQKRSIRDIPLPNSKEISKPAPTAIPKTEPSVGDVTPPKAPTPPQTPSEPPSNNYYEENYSFEEKPSRGFGKYLVILGVILIIAGIFYINRSKAEISVWPKQEDFFVQASYEIENQDNDSGSEVLDYKLLPISKTSTTEVSPSGEEEVSIKASGQIKIINEYSEKDQRLVENTRFQTSKGLIYRIAESVTVPGKTSSGPGEIVVEVFADESGDEYNISQTNFTIPGFEGLPQFDTMYAEGQSNMSGGFVGVKKIVSEEDKAAGLETLKTQIKDQINTEIENYNNEFVILFDEEDINYSSLTENDKNDGVELKISGNINAFAFNAQDLARFLANQNIPNSPDGNVMIDNLNEINFEIVETLIEREDEDTISVTELSVDGNVAIEWIVDSEKIKTTLAGSDRNQFSEKIKDFAEISKAEIDFSPFWKNKLPKAEIIDVLVEEYID